MTSARCLPTTPLLFTQKHHLKNQHIQVCGFLIFTKCLIYIFIWPRDLGDPGGLCWRRRLTSTETDESA